MKRALPSYEDIFEAGEAGEEGEIIESSDFEEEEDFEFGLKTVLPVGKFTDKFKKGQVPETGEEYLCTVRFQRRGLEKILKVEEKSSSQKAGVNLKDLLVSDEVSFLEVERGWSENYLTCYSESEISFFKNLEEHESNPVNFNTSSEWFDKLYKSEEVKFDMSVLKWMNESQETCEKLINLHRKWLEEVDCDVEDNYEKMVTWLQALIMCRDSKLTSPEISNLRQLAALLIRKYGERIEMREIVLVIAKKYEQSDLIKYK